MSADALSRPCAKPPSSSCVVESRSLFSEEKLRSAQLLDVNVKAVITALKNGKLSDDAAWKKAPLRYDHRIQSKLLLDDSGLLCRRFRDVPGERCVPVIPSSLRQLVIKDCHQGVCCNGHLESVYICRGTSVYSDFPRLLYKIFVCCTCQR